MSRNPAIARDVILQVTENNVAGAISASAILRPYLRGRLGPKTFLVRHEEVKTLRKQLAFISGATWSLMDCRKNLDHDRRVKLKLPLLRLSTRRLK